MSSVPLKGDAQTCINEAHTQNTGAQSININRDFQSQERNFYENLFTPESCNSTLSENNFSFPLHTATFKFDFGHTDSSPPIAEDDIDSPKRERSPGISQPNYWNRKADTTYTCPKYQPASQVSPNSIKSLPTQNNGLQIHATIFDNHDSTIPYSPKHQKCRDYYHQLFSSDSEDDSDNDSIDSDRNHSDHFDITSSINQRTATASMCAEDNSLFDHPLVLSEKEEDELLGFNQPLPPPISQQTSPNDHIDKIGTFNVQNKFNHMVAAEMMIKEELTFLALQEPFGAQNKCNKSWSTFSKCELQTARVDCYETQHQVILVDTWKWGGKIIMNFKAFLHGRIATIAFGFGDGSKLGICSIYASSAETHNNDIMGENAEIIEIFEDTKAQWKREFPDIHIIMIGDFQETLTISNKDNIGKFRKDKNSDGILVHMEDSYTSIVRDKLKSIPYVTRMGSAGARGIDHILIPNEEKVLDKFVDARIERDAGSAYFSSDHSLLVCDYHRSDQNNNEDGRDIIKFNYAKIFRIKVKGSGPKGCDIELDKGQFKDSDTFKEQKALYDKLQSLTATQSIASNVLLSDLEYRVKMLNKRIWEEGIQQKVDGHRNKLVEVDDSHALELSYIYRKFDTAIKEIMEQLKLSDWKDSLGASGKVRGRLRQGKGFQHFRNLPITTKMRYLRASIRTKLNLIQKAQSWIAESRLRYQQNGERMDEATFWKNRDTIVKTTKLENQMKIIKDKLYGEQLERESHIEAIASMRSKNCKGYDQSYGDKKQFSYLSNDTTLLLNSWLEESGCEYNFSMQQREQDVDNLAHSISNWKEPLTEYFDPPSFYEDASLWDSMDELLTESLTRLKAVSAKIIRCQSRYRHETLLYFLRVNSIHSFTKKVLYKERSAPATHSVMWDDSIKTFRSCRNEVEELQATQEFHGHWMGDSGADENCAFASIVRKGKLGPRGVNLFPDRKITMEDVNKLVKNGNKLSRKVKRAFVAAHNKHTAKLFKPPNRAHREFFYPFFMINETGDMNRSNMVEENLWKSLASIPGKARHAGFQIAILGRFGSRWRDLLFKLIRIMLILRYIPADLKKISRYPIPKPGKKNEYRPISLCNDLYCFLNSVMTALTSKAIEKCKLLHDGITSYRRGKSCATLVTIEQSFREDCFENNLPTVQIDEDEEKFFDRVCLEIILAVMRINGFPTTGYVELKACMMGEKIVEIITCKGTAYAKFVCGLEQGNPDSPTIANLVIKLKHDVWRTLSKEAKSLFQKESNKGNCDSYVFRTCDPKDLQILLKMLGYCDDNTKFITAHDENDLIFLVKYYIQLAGDLSMVTKIGRKSSKCDIQFFNISAKLILRLQKTWSTAWSFVHNCPIEEEVPFKVCMKEEELQKFYRLSDYENLNLEEQSRWNKIISPPAHRHLGLSGTLYGDTSATSDSVIAKMHDRLAQLKVRSMHPEAQRKCINMLVSTMHSYVPLQARYDRDELDRLDLSIANIVSKKNGISPTDAKHRIFLPESMGGLGIRSAREIDILATAREMEIVSNGEGLDSRTYRARVSAIHTYEDSNDNKIRNHALDSIHKLARLGVQFRDADDGLVTDILEQLAKNAEVRPIGDPLYKDGNGVLIGSGKSKHLQFSMGGKLYKILSALRKNRWIPDETTTAKCSELKIDLDEILKIRKSTGNLRFAQLSSTFSFHEWNNMDSGSLSTSLSSKTEHWNRFSITDKPNISKKQKYELENGEIMEEIRHLHCIDWGKYVIADSAHPNIKNIASYDKFGKILEFLHTRDSPMIIATDGAHLESNRNLELNATSAAFVLCSLDIKVSESLESGEWIHRPMIPLLARNCALPADIGSASSDIAHGECFAFALQELAMHRSFPRILILDSEAVRDQMINIRDTEKPEINRTYIRNTAGGISKFLCSIVTENLWTGNPETKEKESATNNGLEWLITMFQDRNKRFINLAKSWVGSPDVDSTNNDNDNRQTWNKKYFDDNINRTVIKVNSHQLDATGTKMKSKPRYSTLVPNIALLNANHHADVGANMALKLLKETSSNWERNTKLDRPTSNIRFFWTWNGRVVDRHISDFLRTIFAQERMKRLTNKSTQGLLWRISDHISDTWGSIKNRPGLFRALLGFTNTHTRCLYKSTVYREGCLEEFLSHLKDEEQKLAIKNSPIKNQMEYLLSCPWCKQGSYENARKGNMRHSLLTCNKDDIKSFRRKVTNFLGTKLCVFFKDISNTASVSESISLLHTIQDQFMKLQENQTGRLTKICKSRNNSYITISNLLQKHQEKSMEETINKPIFGTICQEIFGMLPNNRSLTIADAELGIIDAPWLGLTPKIVNQHMLKSIRRIGKEHISSDESGSWIEKKSHDWEEIKELNTSRVMGLHRIIKIAGAKREIDLIEKFNLSDLAYKCFKNRLKRKAVMTTQIPQKINDIHNTKKLKSEQKLVKQCNGITCGKERLLWCKNAKFGRNETKLNRKQCQRCCLTSSAMKAASSILAHLQQSTSTKQALFVSTINKIRSTQRVRYISLVDMLQNCIPKIANFQRAQYTSKNKPNEKCKRLCRILIVAIQRIAKLPHGKRTIPAIIQDAISLLDQTISTKEAEILADNLIMRQYAEEVQRRTSSSQNICQIIPNPTHQTPQLPQPQILSPPVKTGPQPILKHDVIILSDTSNANSTKDKENVNLSYVGPARNLKEDVIEDPEPSFLGRHKIDIMNRASYMQGIQLLYATEVLRHKHRDSNIFIACPEASEIINNWEANQGWERFARIFRSREASFRKPNGLYLIPVFSGDIVQGHWHVIAITKRGADRRGYVFDSLGIGSDRTKLTKLIEAAFVPGRGSIRWSTPESIRQQGVECGPRTIHVMKYVCKGFRDTSLDTDCVGKATLTSVTSQSEYSQMKIRHQAASILSAYRPHMATRSISSRSAR